MPPGDDDLDETEEDELDEGKDDDEAEVDSDITAPEAVIEGDEQKLVRLTRRRPDPPPAPPTNRFGEPANRPPAPPDRHLRRRPDPPADDSPSVHAARRPRRKPLVKTEPAPAPLMNHSAPPPLPPPVPSAVPATPVDGNVFFAFEETLKLYPAAAQTIAVERKTGTPANWMLTERPRTANELYAAIKRLHGRREETTYEITCRDGAGHGSGGSVSMPSTMDDPLPPGSPPPNPVYGAPPGPYAPSMPVYAQPPAPSGTPFEAMLAMQKQMFEMLQPKAAAPLPAPPPAAPTAAPDVNALLAMQKQMFEMMQQMQGMVAGQPAQPAPAPVVATSPAPAVPHDPAAAMLAMQKQMFEMMQAMQSGHAPPPAPQPAPAAPTDSTAAMMAMQKQMFDMMLTMMQTAQRSSAPAGGSPPPAGGPYYRPRYGAPSHDPNAPQSAHDPRYPQPPARPQTPSEQLREAASVFRDFRRVADELGFGGQAAEAPEPEDDDSPVRVIDMGPAKGVINRSDGSLRGFETAMANLPDILKWLGEQRVELRKARDEDRKRQQQQLPPGYVMAGPDYQPPEGYIAVPVDQIPPQTQESLPEPPAEMPPPIAEPPPTPPRRAWGLPTMD